MSTDMHTRTVGGLMAYCDWLKEKGYQGPAATDSWKSATKMMFETVEPDGYEDISTEGLDLEDFTRRFQTLAGSKLRAETVSVYQRRIKNAIEAHEYYLENNKPPSFKRGTARPASGASDGSKQKGTRPVEAVSPVTSAAKEPRPTRGLVEFPFPLVKSGQLARLHLPEQGIHPKDAERMITFIKSLTIEEPRQIPERTGEEALAA